MSERVLRYNFVYVDNCNMCGSKTDAHKVLGRRLNRSQGRNPSNKIAISTTISMCTDCRLIYANPQPVPVDIQDHYGVPPEEYWRDTYFRVDANYFAHQIQTLEGLIERREGAKSLDIGAGLGKAMLALSRAGFDAYGFEASKPFYERAISKMGISPDKLKFGMIEEVNYPDATFDFISFGAVLEHLYDPSAAILKSFKWLVPGGIIHIEVPSSDWLINDIINLYYKVRGKDYVTNLSPMHNPFHLYEFGLKSFHAHAKMHSYEIALHQYDVCQTFLPKVTDIIFRPFMKWTDKGMQLTVWLRKA